LGLVLKEWCRVLASGGVLCVSVPDLDVLARLFVDRATLSLNERFQVMRMIFGGHMDASDYHLVGLNYEFLADYLRSAGFTDIRKVDGFGFFEDTSTLKVKGVPISLNVICRKP
jgi:predicted SAM-dependent methyltransferase